MSKSSGKLYFPVCSHKLTLFLCSAADRQAERQTGDAVPTALGGGQRLTRRRFLCGLPLLRPQRDQAAPHLNRFAPPHPPGNPITLNRPAPEGPVWRSKPSRPSPGKTNPESHSCVCSFKHHPSLRKVSLTNTSRLSRSESVWWIDWSDFSAWGWNGFWHSAFWHKAIQPLPRFQLVSTLCLPPRSINLNSLG